MNKLILFWAIFILQIPLFSQKRIKASGNIIKKEFKVSDFNNLNISGSCDINISIGEKIKLEIEAADNVIPIILVDVEEETLNINLGNNIVTNISKTTINLIVPKLELINIIGSCSMKIKNKFSANNLKIIGEGAVNINCKKLLVKNLFVKMKGSSNIKINYESCNNIKLDAIGSVNIDFNNLKCNNFTANIDGSGEMNVKGKTKEMKINGAGTIKILTHNFVSKEANILLKESCDCKAYVSDKLFVNLYGLSELKCMGNPKVVEENVEPMASLKLVKK